MEELILREQNLNNLNKKINQRGKKLNIGIMGGTFDPIHYAHLSTAEYVKETYNLDFIIFIPTGNPPHKSKLITDKIDRYNMVVLATSNNKDFFVSDIEINRENKTYTIDTLKELHRIYKNVNLYFITGADTICDMETWKNVEENFKLATFIATNRPGIDFKKLDNTLKKLKHKYNADIRLVNVPSLDISSTYIRNNIKHGKSIKYLIPECVENYIYEKNIYANGEQ